MPYRETRRGTTKYAYRLYDDEWARGPIFGRWDWKAPEWDTYDEVAFGILRFLSLGEGDVKDPNWWFVQYTPDQLQWRDARTPLLQLLLEEQMAGGRLAQMHRLGAKGKRIRK